MDFRFVLEAGEAEIEVIDPAPMPDKPAPVVPPPCWDSRPILAEDCWRATLIACGAAGGR